MARALWKGAIDDRFFETPYYLVPSKGGERAYSLLREAIRESDRVGIAKFILRRAASGGSDRPDGAPAPQPRTGRQEAAGSQTEARGREGKEETGRLSHC